MRVAIQEESDDEDGDEEVKQVISADSDKEDIQENVKKIEVVSEKDEGNWWKVKDGEMDDLKIEPKKEFKRIAIDENEEVQVPETVTPHTTPVQADEESKF